MNSERLILRNAVALVGEELEPMSFREILIVGDRIAALDDAGDQDGATVLDLDGKFVLPGLIDAHVHFGLAGSLDAYAHWRKPLVARGTTLVRNGIIALAHGITSIRDLGSVDDSVIEYGRLTETGEIIGPRVVACGRPIAMTGGHGWEFAREADGVDEVRKAVREQVRSRAGVIKLMATGGLSTPGNADSLELGPDELAAGIEEAAKAGLRSAAHAHAGAGIRAAVEAGVTSIEHAAFAGPAEVELMRSSGTYLVPTLVAVANVRPGSGIDPEVIAKTEAAREIFHANVEQAIRGGVTIAAGTDAGTALNPIGLLVDELQLYGGMGLGNLDVIRTATVTAGQLLGLPVGSIEPGFFADLIVTNGDPRDDLELLRRPELVISAGRAIDPTWARRTALALGREESDRLLHLDRKTEEVVAR
jgi:imidazolonepropionase-like amidohydrolase